MNQALRLVENNAAPGTSILVVEDDPRVRGQISEYLRSRDFTVFEVETGDEALSFLDHDASHIDCVFSDVQMPGRRDGVALARWVLANRPGLPILLTSAEYRSEDLDPTLRPILYVLPKPYRGHTVEAALAAQVVQFRLRV
jgi:CheY-like chemotaxis protein